MIKRNIYGLVYKEDFDNTDPWTAHDVNLGISVGNYIIISGGAGHIYLDNVNVSELFIQTRLAGMVQAWIYLGCLARHDQETLFDCLWAFGHWARTSGDIDRLYEYIDNEATTLVSYNHGNVQRTLGAQYDHSLWLNSNLFRMFFGCNQGGHNFEGSNVTQLQSGAVGLKGTAGASGNFRVYRYNVMKHKDISCSGLPTGWKLRIDEDDNYKATESGGTATVDCFDLVFPVTKVEVLDAGDVVKDTFEASNDVWGGDEYLYSIIGKNLVSQGLSNNPLIQGGLVH